MNYTSKEEGDLFYVLELDLEANYLYLNDKFKSVYNLDIYELGKNALPSIIDADHPKFFETVEACKSEPDKPFFAFLRKKSDKGNIMNQWQITAMTDQKGEIEKFRAVGFELEDVIGDTERQKKLVQELTLERDTLSELIFKIGHDLRSPLATLKGLLNLYEKTPEKLDVFTLKELAGKLDDKLKKLNASLRANATQPTYELINFSQIIKDALKPYNGEILSQSYFIGINVRVSEVYLIPEYVQSIFDNLISNAMKYKSHERKLDMEIEVIDTKNNKIQITVWDNGQGLSKEKWEKHIQRPEHLYLENKLSNGVGLYLIKSQVEQMNGTISMTSEKDKFTEITITFSTNKY